MNLPTMTRAYGSSDRFPSPPPETGPGCWYNSTIDVPLGLSWFRFEECGRACVSRCLRNKTEPGERPPPMDARCGFDGRLINLGHRVGYDNVSKAFATLSRFLRAPLILASTFERSSDGHTDETRFERQYYRDSTREFEETSSGREDKGNSVQRGIKVSPRYLDASIPRGTSSDQGKSLIPWRSGVKLQAKIIRE